MRNKDQSPLSMEQLRAAAPAVFADSPDRRKVSEAYSFVPTSLVLDTLRGEGWYPVEANQRFTRTKVTQYQKHLVRLRHRGSEMEKFVREVGDIFPELILINAHDAGACFELRFGIYRLACSNGMVVADAEFGSYKIRHMGFKQDDILDASFKVVESAPKVIEDVKELKSIRLIEPAREFYAARAAKLRWGTADPVRVQGLLSARRTEDQGIDLFTAFNTVQENLIRGGVEGRSLSGRRIKTQPIRSIDRDISINSGLWGETKRMAEMVRLGRTRWPEITR